MDIEGPGDFAEGFPFFSEILSEGTLVWAQFGPAVERDTACLGVASSFLGSGGDQRALELRDASEHGEHHTPSRLCCKPDEGVSQSRTTNVLASCFGAGQTVL